MMESLLSAIAYSCTKMEIWSFMEKKPLLLVLYVEVLKIFRVQATWCVFSQIRNVILTVEMKIVLAYVESGLTLLIILFVVDSVDFNARMVHFV